MAGGGGGWYGGGAALVAGGGSGWLFTEDNFNTWTPDDSDGSSTWDKAKFELDGYTESDGSFTYELSDAMTIRGDGTEGPMPDPLYEDFNPKKPDEFGSSIAGKSGSGFVRITYLGE
jgi:hypothetical protein